MDVITIKDLALSTHIGVPDTERAEEQELLISVDLYTDTQAAAESDDIAQTIDYERVANDIKELGAMERKTIERLAEDIANMILKKYAPTSVEVSIKKFILPDVKHVGITIARP